MPPITPQAAMPPLSWDIFCRVVDNFGDAGVCWRLARQIARERGETVRLWVDDVATLAAFVPDLDAQPRDTLPNHAGVDLRHLHATQPFEPPRAVVIEAFGCGLPPDWLDGMAAMPQPPLWINLEYLSAEDWVAGCHGLPSRHPRLPLTLHFFFPGFTDDTGGLLRERDILQQQARLHASAADCTGFLGRFGYAGSDGLPMSLFCYANPALPALLDHWRHGTPRCLLVADGLPRRQVESWLQQPFPVGCRQQRGALMLIALPFLPQDDYDRLLGACHLNFVRGEDSLVRAQWAGRPAVWHIYPTDDGAHFVKLKAFLQRYAADCPPEAALAQQDFALAWNQGDVDGIARRWQALEATLAPLAGHARHWAEQLAAQPDLLSKLVAFISAKRAAALPVR